MSLSISVNEIVDKTTNALLSTHPTWLRVSLNDICSVLNGYAFKSSGFTNKKTGMPLIRIRDVQHSTVETYYSGDYPSEYIVNVGDILVGMDGDFNCKKWKNIPALLNQRVCKIEVISKYYINDFLYYSLPPYLTEINLWTSAVTVKHLSSFAIQEIPLPLPPLNEQKRIVAKLDAIMPSIDAVNERLGKVPRILKRFRQSVLTAAVTGRLTEQWREEHPEVESAEVLLEKIRQDREKCFKQECEDAKKDGKRLPKLNISEKKAELSGVDLSWINIEIQQIYNVETGATPLKSDSTYYENGTIPWIKSGDVQNCDVFSCEERITEKALKETNVKYYPMNSLLIAMYGEGKTRGQIGKIKFKATSNQACAALVNPDLDESTVNYTYLFGLSQYEQLRMQAAGGNQPNLNLTKIKEWIIPLPPLEEQKEIVRQVEKLFTLADTVEAHYQKAKARVDKLSQSVLAKAFRGELVPQDPNDESAEKLLERILEEKTKMEAELKGARKKGAKKTVKKSEGGK